MKKIAVINGHPNKESFNFAIVEAYSTGARSSAAEVREITLAEMTFKTNLQH